MKNIAFLSLLCLLLFSCRKDSDTELTITKDYVPPIIEINVNASVEGIVVEESGAPVDQAVVRIGNQTTRTNHEGLFVINDMIMNQSGTLLSVEKEGFFDGSMRFFPKSDSKNFTTLTLLEKQIIGTIDPATGGEVSSSEGILLNFPPNSVVDANNQTYTGTVSVAARWLDPEAENIFQIMPGNLQGIDQENNEVALISFGMMAVELLDDSGNELQLGNGQKATLSFPLSDDYRSKAPAEIPLWYFDEDSGLWEEEGKASLQSNYYVGEVSHFSFWNCDAPHTLVQLSGRVLVNTFRGKVIPVANAHIKVNTSGLGCGYGYTDQNGYFTGAVPKGVELELVITNQPGCNSVVYIETLDPLEVDTDLGDILVDIPTDKIIEVSGSLLDCFGKALNDAWVKIIIDGKSTLRHVNANTFNISILNCSNVSELQIIGVDFDANIESTPATLSIQKETDAGAIEVCGNPVTDFLRLTVDGEEKFFLSQIIKISQSQFILKMAPGQTEGVRLSFFVIAPPIIPDVYNQNNVANLQIEGNFALSPNFISGGCNGPDPTCSNFAEINLIQYNGVIGDYVKGSFNGIINLTDGSTTYSDILFSCEFSLPLM